MDQNDQNQNSNQLNGTSNEYYYKKKNNIPWYQSSLIPFLSVILGASLILARYVRDSKLLEVFTSTIDRGNVTNAPACEKGGNTKDKEPKFNSVSKMVKDVSPSLVGVINKQKVSV